MRGPSAALGDTISTQPREVGRRLQTLAVKAGKRCSGSPNLSSDSGCTWYSRLDVACDSSDLVNTPSWLGALLRGPPRRHADSRPISIWPKRLLASPLSERMPSI